MSNTNTFLNIVVTAFNSTNYNFHLSKEYAYGLKGISPNQELDHIAKHSSKKDKPDSDCEWPIKQIDTDYSHFPNDIRDHKVTVLFNEINAYQVDVKIVESHSKLTPDPNSEYGWGIKSNEDFNCLFYGNGRVLRDANKTDVISLNRETSDEASYKAERGLWRFEFQHLIRPEAEYISFKALTV